MSIRPFTSRILAGQHSRVALSSQAASRAFSGSSLRAYPRVDSQDRESINTEATEYSKSASDHESAHQADAAFDPALTDPQEQKEVAGKNTGGSNNPLDVSPANPEVSKARGNTEGGPENSSGSSSQSSERNRTSGGSDPNRKGGKVA